MDWREEDPGLPIKLGPVSNGEFLPQPLGPTVRRTFPDGNNTLGPTTLAEVKRFHDYHQGRA